MKKLLTSIAVLAMAASVLAQGTINYNNRITGSVVAPVYGPEPSPNETLSKTGNTSAGFPTGTQTYGGAFLAGSGFSVALWAGPQGTDQDSLVLVSGTTTTFRTGGFSGFLAPPGGAYLATISGVAEASRATLQLRAWDNAGGTITSWDNAVIKGRSLAYVSEPLGGLAPAPNMTGLGSFNIYVIPEPTAWALMGVGAAALLIFRRRKN